MKAAIILALAVTCVCGIEDPRSKRSLLLETPATFYGAYAGAYAPFAPIAPVAAPLPYAAAYPYPGISPVVARASRVVGVPGFVPRWPYGYSPYPYWNGGAVYLRR